MEQTIENKKYLSGSISTYVLMLFGMVVVFYMMGFTNMWTFWNAQGSAAAGAGGITSDIFSNPNTFYFIIFGALTAIAVPALVVRYFGGSTILAYIVPLVFLFIFINIFVFPVTQITNHFSFAGTFITGAIMAFFNIFLILSIMEFVRTGTT